MFSKKQFQQLLKCYRQDVPFAGTITQERADELLEEGKICRGRIFGQGRLEYFHIIKSPTHYPELTMLLSDSEETLLETTVMLGMQNNVDLEDLFTN